MSSRQADPRPAPRRVVVVSGNPKAASRTTAVAQAVADRLAGALADESSRPEIVTIELADLGPELFDWTSERCGAAVDQVRDAVGLVVASPVYKASYTGLLKAFLDWFGAGSLAGVPCAAVMLGGSPAHALAVEVHLRPVLGELGASTLPGCYVTESELDLLDDAIAHWWEDGGRLARAASAAPLAVPPPLLSVKEDEMTTIQRAPAPARGSDAAAAQFDAARFRQVLGHYPTGVTVVTALHPDGEPVGMAVGSFTSVSLDPPLVAFFPEKKSSTFPRIREAGSFCVNVLASHQSGVCRSFAMKGLDRFDGISWRPAGSGSPVLDGVVAWIDCDIESVTEAGDHYLVAGRVRALDVEDASLPLMFFRGGYGEFSSHSLVVADEPDLVRLVRASEVARPELEALAAELGLECTVSAPVDANLVVLASAGVSGSESGPPMVGRRIPMIPPLGGQFMAWEPPHVIEEWLGRSPVPLSPELRHAYEQTLARVREDGWLVYRDDSGFASLDQFARSTTSAGVGTEIYEEFQKVVAGLGPGFDVLDVDAVDAAGSDQAADLRVSRVIVPVRGPDGRTCLAVNAHLDGGPCDQQRLARVRRVVTAAASRIERAIAGQRSSRRRTNRPPSPRAPDRPAPSRRRPSQMPLQGVVGALLTPFAPSGEVARPTLERLYDFMVPHCDSVSVLGAEVSEYAMLSPALRRGLLAESVRALASRTTVLAGVSAPTPAEVLDLTELAAGAGAHFAQVLLPSRPAGGPPSAGETIAFVEAVASRSPLPVVLYHHPGRGCDPDFATLVEACSVDNVVAMKDSSRDISRNLRAVEEIQKAGHAQYLGTIQPMLAIMLSGGAGAMTPAGLTLVAAAIRDALAAGDLALAGRMQTLIGRFPAAWGKYGLMPLAKAALECLGIPMGTPAYPYDAVPEDLRPEIKNIIATWERELPYLTNEES
ncbi:hypothetical protein GCM10027062_21630 [Nocardioides hungaricus]